MSLLDITTPDELVDEILRRKEYVRRYDQEMKGKDESSIDVEDMVKTLLAEARYIRQWKSHLWSERAADAIGELLRAYQTNKVKEIKIHPQTTTIQTSSRTATGDETKILTQRENEQSKQLAINISSSQDAANVNFIMHNVSEVDTKAEIRRYLETDPTFHTIDARDFLRIFVGWCCIFLFCHVPWIVSVFLLLYNYQKAGSPACNARESVYIFGFVILFLINIGVSLVSGLSLSIDGGNNVFVKYAPYATCITSGAIIIFNVFGVLIVWENESINECSALRNLGIAQVTMFLILPCTCYFIQSQFGSLVATRNPAQKNNQQKPNASR